MGQQTLLHSEQTGLEAPPAAASAGNAYVWSGCIAADASAMLPPLMRASCRVSPEVCSAVAETHVSATLYAETPQMTSLMLLATPELVAGLQAGGHSNHRVLRQSASLALLTP